MYEIDAISDEYLNDFFERVQFKHAPSKVKWVRAEDFGAILRGTVGAIEVGWESVQDSRTDEPREVGPLLLGPFWPTGDFDADVEQFRDLMYRWVIHEMDEHFHVDGELWRDPHDLDNHHGSFYEQVIDEHEMRWNPYREEALT
jgi:hypothetical protein